MRVCLQVRAALASGNVMRFFRLYLAAPLLSRRLMDAAVGNLRFKLLCALVRSHRPTAVSLTFLTSSLGFTTPEQQEGGGDGSTAAALQQQRVAQGAPTVDASGQLLPGCSVPRCVGDHEPCVEGQQGVEACLEWCKRHGAVFDQEQGEEGSIDAVKLPKLIWGLGTCYCQLG